MAETIMVDERTRIAHIDKMNWTVQVLRDEPGGQRWRQANGDGHGPFFGKLHLAFAWLLDYMTERDLPEQTDLDGYVRAHRKAADRLIAVAKELSAC